LAACLPAQRDPRKVQHALRDLLRQRVFGLAYGYEDCHDAARLADDPMHKLAVARDMWEPYSNATLDHVPDPAGRIVFDRFHVMGYVGKAVDTVRKQEHRDLMAAGNETLKGSKYLWLYSRGNVPERRRDAFQRVRHKELKVGRAWAITESLRRLWYYVYPVSGRKFWKHWYFWATHSRLEPIRNAAETVRRHIDNILTYYQHPVTNAMSEGINSKIQKIKRMACGFRNIEYFKTAIDFHREGSICTHAEPGSAKNVSTTISWHVAVLRSLSQPSLTPCPSLLAEQGGQQVPLVCLGYLVYLVCVARRTRATGQPRHTRDHHHDAVISARPLTMNPLLGSFDTTNQSPFFYASLNYHSSI
jgi:hypothetical protein